MEFISSAEITQQSREEAHRAISRGLAELMGEVVKIDPQQLLTDESQFARLRFSSFGIDSFMAMTLLNRVRGWLGVDLPTHLLIGDNSVAEVVELLYQNTLLRAVGQGSSAGLQDERSDIEEIIL